MSEDPVRSAIDAIRTQIQAELETQLGALERQHAAAIESVRQEERAAADQRWTEQMDRVRSDGEARLQSALADAVGEAERRIQAEASRVRLEIEEKGQERLEQVREDAAASLEQARAGLQQTLEAERASHAEVQSAQAERIGHLERELEGAGEQAQALQNELTEARAQQEKGAAELNAAREALEQTRLAFDTERSAAQQALEHERHAVRTAADAQAAREREAGETRAAERQSQLAVTERLLSSVRAIGQAGSLTDVLALLARCAAAEASRAVVLIQRDGVLQAVAACGFESAPTQHKVEGNDVLETAIRGRQRVAVTPATAPAFAGLPVDRAGLAVPVVVGGQAVAVLYADNSLAESPEVPASWPEAVEILGCHASAVLSQLTAVRTAQAMRLMRGSAHKSEDRTAGASGDEDQAARRYARLLVSEIKLYNESAVRVGREKRDLLIRLGPEVDRARRLYEERVPITVAARAQYFEQELRQTLADGDASLLGDQVVIP